MPTSLGNTFRTFRVSLGIYISVIVSVLLLITCTVSKQDDAVIARVSDRTITRSEFQNRADLTVRPAYASGNSRRARNILLNTLIAEKILALEGQKDALIRDNERLINYVRGLKEQKMRELHFRHHALEKTEVPGDLVDVIADQARRTYDLEYFDINPRDHALVDSIFDILGRDSTQFETVFRNLYPKHALPRQRVNWQDVFHPDLFESLYLNRAEPGKIIGPVYDRDGRVLCLRVDGWRTTVTFAETDRHVIRRQVQNHLRIKKALMAYESIIAGIMQDKQLVFNREGLITLTNMLGPLYFENPAGFNPLHELDPRRRWHQEMQLDSLLGHGGTLAGGELLEIDGSKWSIAELIMQMQRRPLLFRRKHFPAKEFGPELALAIVDLVRDYYITAEAYRQGYDQNAEVRRTEQLWQDYFYAVLQREKLLAARIDSTEHTLDYLTTQVQNLRSQYTPLIEVNREAFEQTEISAINTLVFARDVPFPVVAPGFPVLTRDDTL
jgi:hypothetical protein